MFDLQAIENQYCISFCYKMIVMKTSAGLSIDDKKTRKYFKKQ